MCQPLRTHLPHLPHSLIWNPFCHAPRPHPLAQAVGFWVRDCWYQDPWGVSLPRQTSLGETQASQEPLIFQGATHSAEAHGVQKVQESSRNDLLFIVCVRTYAFSWGEGLWVSPAGLNLCSGLEPPPPGLPPWCTPAAIALHTPRSPWGLEPWSAAPALEGSLAVSSRLLSPARTLSAALLCSLAQEPWTQAQGPLSPWPHFSIPSPDVSTAAIGGRLGSPVPLGSLLLRPRTEPGPGRPLPGSWARLGLGSRSFSG